MLLNKPINLDDIESVDSELHSSLRWILDNDISGVIDHTFSVEHDSFGVVQTHELKKDGKTIPVSETSSIRTRRDYREMMCLLYSLRSRMTTRKSM